MAKVKEIKFALVYVDDFDKAVAFYTKHFEFAKEFDMGSPEKPEVFGKIGDVGIWIGGGYERRDVDTNTCRATPMLGVDSVGDLFKQLKDDNVKVVQDEPVAMQGDMFWMQFADPAGNVFDVLGGK